MSFRQGEDTPQVPVDLFRLLNTPAEDLQTGHVRGGGVRHLRVIKIGQLREERERAVAPVGVGGTVVPHAEAPQLLPVPSAVLFQIVVLLPCAAAPVNGRGKGLVGGRLGCAQAEGDVIFSGNAVEPVIDGRGRLALVPVGPAEPRVVQGVDERRADPVDQLHHGLRLRQHVVEMESFVICREGPVHLGNSRRPEEIAGVLIDIEGPLQPPLIFDQTVRVPCLHDVPGVSQSFPQGGILRQRAGKVF